MLHYLGQFLRDYFFVLLLTGLFVLTYLFWVFNTNPEMAAGLKEINNGVFYALLALLGIRPLARPVVPAIHADNIESASTQSGDINLAPTNAPADAGKEKENENQITDS